MLQSSLVLLKVFSFLCIALVVKATKCPEFFPILIEDECYDFQERFFDVDNANRDCRNRGSLLATIKSPYGRKVLEKMVNEFVSTQMEDAMFWIGLRLDQHSSSRYEVDREWIFTYDNARIVQKDYTLWDEAEGPTDRSLSCAALNASSGLLKPVNCNRHRFKVICMMANGASCADNWIPYIRYGDYCIAIINQELDYGRIGNACYPGRPAPYTEELKEFVSSAVNNSYLGGVVIMHIRTVSNNDYVWFADFTDGTMVEDYLWEGGRPRISDEARCAGYSLQADGTLKLKAVSCNYAAVSLCFTHPLDEPDDRN